MSLETEALYKAIDKNHYHIDTVTGEYIKPTTYDCPQLYQVNFRKETVQNSIYCGLCNPIMLKDEAISEYTICTICPKCNVYVPLKEGFHVYCDLCNNCTKSSTTHRFCHYPGQCKGCTIPLDVEKHSWCALCNSCYPYLKYHKCNN
jgi:hypothetical protein